MKIKREITAFLFGFVLTLSIVLCCFAFKTADNYRTNETAIGGEVFTIALPMMLVMLALRHEKRATQTQRKKNLQLKAELKQQEKVIQNLARDLHYLKSPPTARVNNVAEKPTE